MGHILGLRVPYRRHSKTMTNGTQQACLGLKMTWYTAKSQAPKPAAGGMWWLKWKIVWWLLLVPRSLLHLTVDHWSGSLWRFSKFVGCWFWRYADGFSVANIKTVWPSFAMQMYVLCGWNGGKANIRVAHESINRKLANAAVSKLIKLGRKWTGIRIADVWFGGNCQTTPCSRENNISAGTIVLI